jgi:hypothetical protein
MKKYRLVIDLDVDEHYIGDSEDKEWLENVVLSSQGQLLLHSNFVGDNVGQVKVLKIWPD